jgi:hypothetical protein
LNHVLVFQLTPFLGLCNSFLIIFQVLSGDSFYRLALSYALCSDLNSRHRSWNCSRANQAGSILFAEMNTDNFTIYHPTTSIDHFPVLLQVEVAVQREVSDFFIFD